MNYNYEKEV